MDLPGVGVDSITHGIIAHGMARLGDGVVGMAVIMDTTIIMEEVTDMLTIHLPTSTCQMAVRLSDVT